MTSKLPHNSYAWRLEAAIWTKVQEIGDEVRCKPRLLLVSQSDWQRDVPEVMGYIEYDIGGKEIGRASWLVYHYPKDDKGLYAYRDEATFYGMSVGRQLLNEGEICHPRDSAEAAFKHLLELTADKISSTEHKVLEKVGITYLSFLKEITEIYVRRVNQLNKPATIDA